MLHRITRRLRAARRQLEAGRREMALHDQMAYHGETWTLAQWNRAIRNSDRLNRLALGKSPWVRFGNI